MQCRVIQCHKSKTEEDYLEMMNYSIIRTYYDDGLIEFVLKIPIFSFKKIENEN